jgi:hypothetical protein
MGISQAERSIIEKARAVGTSELAVPLSDAQCCYLIGVIVSDLGLGRQFPELPKRPELLSSAPPDSLMIDGVPFWPLAEKLCAGVTDAVTYFSCLSAMHKSRLKYSKIIENQPLPTMDQVGPRSLLQYGSMSPSALSAFIFWRKWLYDIDNRAAQETGYLFEPIIAHAIGGVPISATRSPVRRRGDTRKGRQVDCIRDNRAYEIKMRVTIAASGQGRWREELDFPLDCIASGYTPVLVVFDPTENPKLTELIAAFKAQRGEVHIGDDAWHHLDEQAGPIMATFIEKYVRLPIQAILNESPQKSLPELHLRMDADRFVVKVNREEYTFRRKPQASCSDDDLMPLAEDVDEEIPGI